MRLKSLLLLTLALPLCAWANMGPDGFYAFKKRIFVETGSLCGDSIQKALDAGFKVVYSMDIDVPYHNISKQRFAGNKNVKLFLKDSGSQLWGIIKHFKEPVTFWLDAHNGFPDPNAKGVQNTPLMAELEQIKRHPIKTHTILIDDLHCC